MNASNGVIHLIDSVLIPPGLNLDGPGTSAPAESSDAKPADANTAMRLSGERLTPVELIDLAIERGVPQFNAGNVVACAAIYEIATRAMLANENADASRGGLPGEARTALQLAIEKARGESDATDRAWALRRGLDAARTSVMPGTGR